jgi:serine/threonine protein kinase
LGDFVPWVASPGDVVDGRYTLTRRIGSGGMGVVYEGQHISLGFPVAIKFCRSDKAASLNARLPKEAHCAARLRHENIAQVLDLGAAGGRNFIVFEYVDGNTISEVLEREGPLHVERALRLFEQLLQALAVAHQAGIIHRDLKTDNLMLTQRGDGTELLKVLDFGIARSEPSSLDLPTDGSTDGVVRGTVDYLAPEVARGESRGDALSDLYSAGVVLYELLSGQRPHPGRSPNAVLYHITTEDPLPLRFARAAVPDDVAHFTHQLLGPPSGRPRSAEEALALNKSLLTRFTLGRSGTTGTLVVPLRKPSSYALAIVAASVGLTVGWAMRSTNQAEASPPQPSLHATARSATPAAQAAMRSAPPELNLGVPPEPPRVPSEVTQLPSSALPSSALRSTSLPSSALPSSALRSTSLRSTSLRSTAPRTERTNPPSRAPRPTQSSQARSAITQSPPVPRNEFEAENPY